MPEKKYFITTAIDYTNGAPHIGHAYEKVLADAMTRFLRLAGHEVFLLTGVDQHGQKVQQTAEKAGVSPEDYVRGVTDKFIALWDRLNVRPDGWAETIDTRHKRIVQALLTKLHETGQLYKKTTSGFYSTRQEQYLSDKDRDQSGTFGPEWGEVVELEEENWYFRLSDHVPWLREYLAGHADAVFPPNRLTQLINSAADSAGMDLCISRPKSRLRWGIEIPFDPEYVTYVWFDALTNYISFAGYADPEPGVSGLPKWEETWPGREVVHVIGKDILIPAHGIYWLIMLHACGFADAELPKILVHGWWNVKGEKMSKSLGNVINPSDIADVVGVDGLRYYLLADIATGQDSDMSEERVLFRYNKELADILGNLLNRTLNMARKYLDGKIVYPEEQKTQDLELLKMDESVLQNFVQADASEVVDGLPPEEMTYAEILGYGNLDETENSISRRVNQLAYRLKFNVILLPRRALKEMEVWRIDRVCQLCINIAREANEFIDKTQPYKLFKDPEHADLVPFILRHVAETMAHLSVLLSPVIPETAEKMQQQLGWTVSAGLTLGDLKWGLLPDGHALGEPKPLFPKVLLPAAE